MSDKNYNKYMIFGTGKQWAVSVDDGCLRLHPDFQNNPKKTSHWIWREAFDFIVDRGGFDAVVELLQADRSESE